MIAGTQGETDMLKKITDYRTGEEIEAFIFSGGASKTRTAQTVKISRIIKDPWGKVENVLTVRRWVQSKQDWSKGEVNSLVYPEHIIETAAA
jgi:hypothetical protein